MTGATPEELLALDVDDLHGRVGAALAAASARLRRRTTGRTCAGRRPRRAGPARPRPARRATCRGALLIAADLRGADLGDADLLGADLRDADVRGADLATALFLSQPQVNAMRGDAATTLPTHWPAPPLDRPGTCGHCSGADRARGHARAPTGLAGTPEMPTGHLQALTPVDGTAGRDTHLTGASAVSVAAPIDAGRRVPECLAADREPTARSAPRSAVKLPGRHPELPPTARSARRTCPQLPGQR